MKLSINLISISLVLFFTECSTTPYVDDYTRSRPNFVDVVGTYRFEKETIHETDTIHYPATIEIKADGRFEGSGIPDLVNDGKDHYDKKGLISSAGKWSIAIDSVETNRRTKTPHWGVKLSRMPESVSFIGFMGSMPPYEMIVNYDDPDLGLVMIFSKK
jgi:hypothetical protein